MEYYELCIKRSDNLKSLKSQTTKLTQELENQNSPTSMK